MIKKGIHYLFSLMNLQISKLEVRKKVDDPLFEKVGRYLWFKEYKFATIIDIGANEGQFSNKIITVFPDAQIHCFEPLPDVFQKLKKNFKDNKNVSVYNFGLGEANEEKDIFNNEYSPSSSMLELDALHKETYDFAVKVKPKRIAVRKLDDFFPEKIKRPLLLKVDVQGYEMFVLKGGENVVMQADVVVIEASFYPLYKGQPLFNDIYAFLIDRGFEYKGNAEEMFNPEENKVLQVDAVFINKNSTAVKA